MLVAHVVQIFAILFDFEEFHQMGVFTGSPGSFDVVFIFLALGDEVKGQAKPPVPRLY